jgi:periplasmic copper chaperone A
MASILRRRLLLAPLAILATGAAPETIEITHPWAKPSAAGAAELFVTFLNTGEKRDRLLSATTPIAEEVLLCEADGALLEYLDLFPRRPLDLHPGWRYIALRGLKGPLAIDDSFPVTFRFSHAGEITITAKVEEGEPE